MQHSEISVHSSFTIASFPASSSPLIPTRARTHSTCSQLPFLLIPAVSLPWELGIIHGRSLRATLPCLPYSYSAKECLNPSLQPPIMARCHAHNVPCGRLMHNSSTRCTLPLSLGHRTRSPSLPAVAPDSGPLNSQQCPHSNKQSPERESRLLTLQSKLPIKDDAS